MQCSLATVSRLTSDPQLRPLSPWPPGQHLNTEY